MDAMVNKVKEQAERLGMGTAVEFAPQLLAPETRIREFCLENKCGNYLGNYACPPYCGSLEEIDRRLRQFNRGILLRGTWHLEVIKGNREIRESRVEFHNRVLQLEEFLRARGVERMWGMSGGSCGLCEVCRAKLDEPCLYPDKVRTTLEALGVDVMALLKRLGLDGQFYPDKITWTGCILF